MTIEIHLNSPEGNAFFILSKVQQAMRESGASREEIRQYQDDAMSGDYLKLLEESEKRVDIVFVS